MQQLNRLAGFSTLSLFLYYYILVY